VPHRPSAFRRLVALLLPLAAALGGCTTWSRRPVSAPGDDRFFAAARVTPVHGEPILLDRVTVSHDGVVGRRHAPPHARVAFAAGEVRRVEARRADPMATAMVAVVPILAAVVLWASFEVRKLGTDH
jgi:hypothetical protein